MAAADRMFYAGFDLPVQWWILYRIAVISVLAPSTPWLMFCSKQNNWWSGLGGLSNTSIHQVSVADTSCGKPPGFPHEVSATDTWCMLVGSCLQCRNASAIWFVNHWWHLTWSKLISVWPCCTPGPWSTNTWCSASDGGYLRRHKGQLKKTAGSAAQCLAQEDANAVLLSTLWRSEIAVGHGAAQRSLGLRDDDDGDDDEGCKTCVKNGQ